MLRGATRDHSRAVRSAIHVLVLKESDTKSTTMQVIASQCACGQGCAARLVCAKNAHMGRAISCVLGVSSPAHPNLIGRDSGVLFILINLPTEATNIGP